MNWIVLELENLNFIALRVNFKIGRPGKKIAVLQPGV